MNFSRRLTLILLALAIAVPASAAEWYDDYFDGIDAAKNKNWPTVIQKMNDAIAKKPNEERKAKTYGVQFIAYHPYYYRGVAYLNQGKWADAVEDLKRTTGVGELNLGEPSTLLITANQQLVADQIRNQQPATPPPAQQQPATPPRPSGPDPQVVAAKERAQEAIQTARARLNRAQQADASIHAASEFDSASNLLKQATSANVNASSATDYNRVADLADRAARAFDASVASAELRAAQLERQRRAQQQTPAPTPTTRPTPPPSNRAAEDTLSETRQRLKQALQAYFEGDFSRSASQLEQLTLDQPNNAMIFAFLGASRYYDYYLRGQSDATTLQRAKEAFRQAKNLNPSLALSDEYFSPRVRGFYEQID